MNCGGIDRFWYVLQYLISSIFYFQTPNILQYYFQIAILGRDSRGD